MKENTLKKLGASAAVVLTGVFAAASNQLVAFAGEDSGGKGGVDATATLKKMKNGSSDGGTFSDVLSKLFTVGTDLYTVIITISLVCFVISLAVLGISLAMNKNPQKREENKSHLFTIAIACCIVFGAPTLVLLVVGIVQSI